MFAILYNISDYTHGVSLIVSRTPLISTLEQAALVAGTIITSTSTTATMASIET